MATTIRLSERQELCAAPVTLDGQRAKVMGYTKPYATVMQVKTGLSAEWSWEAVARIVARGGAFHS